MLRAFVACVLVAVIVKLPVTTRLPADTLPRLTNPWVATRFPKWVAAPLTVKFCVDTVDNTFRSPATLEYPI